MREGGAVRLKIEGLTFSYGDGPAIQDVSLHVNRGEFVGLIGPNGSGKSTVLKNVYRALTPDRGTILLDGEDITKMPYRKSARKMAVVGQENDVPFDFMAEEIVAMGRTPHKRLFDTDNAHDRYIVHHALEHVGMQDMARRSYLHMSGGEKQRVIIARAVAQESDFLILDEPTNHLDVSCQMMILDFIRRLNITVLSAIHDLNMASLYCDRLYVLKGGRIALQGTPEEVLTADNIRRVYGVESAVERHPITGRMAITFLPAEIRAGARSTMEV